VAVGIKLYRWHGEAVIKGGFNLSGCDEFFVLPLSFWTRNLYIENWKFSISRGLGVGRNTAIITSMRSPKLTNFVSVWAFYYGGQEVCVQNRIIFLEDLSEAFNVKRLNEYVGVRRTHNEDGVRISEWVVPLQDVLAGFEGLR
jgi:hypothetical protein